MNQFNEESQKHGIYEYYYPNGKLCSKENYVNGKRHGLYESYYSYGKLHEIQYNLI